MITKRQLYYIYTEKNRYAFISILLEYLLLDRRLVAVVIEILFRFSYAS